MEGKSGNCVGGPEPSKHPLWASLMDYPISGCESLFSNAEWQSAPLEASLPGSQGRNKCYPPTGGCATLCCLSVICIPGAMTAQPLKYPRGPNEGMALRQH